jgi:hypothetical protein
VLTGFWLGVPKVRDRWEDLGVGGGDNIKLGIDGENWIRLVQDRVQWRDFVSTVLRVRVSQRKQATV